MLRDVKRLKNCLYCEQRVSVCCSLLRYVNIFITRTTLLNLKSLTSRHLKNDLRGGGEEVSQNEKLFDEWTLIHF